MKLEENQRENGKDGPVINRIVKHIKNVGFSLEFQQEWSQFFFWRKDHFNWYSFHVFQFYVEGGGYKGNYLEVGIALLGLSMLFEAFHRPSRNKFSEEMASIINNWQEAQTK